MLLELIKSNNIFILQPLYIIFEWLKKMKFNSMIFSYFQRTTDKNTISIGKDRWKRFSIQFNNIVDIQASKSTRCFYRINRMALGSIFFALKRRWILERSVFESTYININGKQNFKHKRLLRKHVLIYVFV